MCPLSLSRNFVWAEKEDFGYLSRVYWCPTAWSGQQFLQEFWTPSNAEGTVTEPTHKGCAEVSHGFCVHSKGELDKKFGASRTCHTVCEWARVRASSCMLWTRSPGAMHCLPAFLILFFSHREISGRNTDALVTLPWYFPLHFTSQQYWKGEMLGRVLQMWKSVRSLLHHGMQPHRGRCWHKGWWLCIPSHSSTFGSAWARWRLLTFLSPASETANSAALQLHSGQRTQPPVVLLGKRKGCGPSKTDETWKAELGKHRCIST